MSGLRRDFAERIASEMPQHNVAGHWKYRANSGDPNCQHVFVPTSENHEHYGLCRQFRWRVKAYVRGNPEVGVLVQDRIVVKND